MLSVKLAFNKILQEEKVTLNLGMGWWQMVTTIILTVPWNTSPKILKRGKQWTSLKRP